MISTQALPSKITNKEHKKTDKSPDIHHNPTLTVKTSRPRVVATSSKTLSNVNKSKKCYVLNMTHNISPILPMMKSKKNSTKKQVQTILPSKSVKFSGLKSTGNDSSVSIAKPWLEAKTNKTEKLNNLQTSTAARKKPKKNKIHEMINDLRIFLNNVGFLIGLVMLILSLTIISQNCS